MDLDTVLSSKSSRRAFLRAAGRSAAAVPIGSSMLPLLGAGRADAATGSAPLLSAITPSGTLNVANQADPNFIDPAKALELYEWIVCRNIYDGLVEWDSTYTKVIGSLATSYDFNSNATVWHFKLRPGVRFHDGTPFDSKAVSKTIRYYIGKTWGSIFDNLTHIDDSNPREVTITFSKPSPDLDRNATFVKIMAPSLIDANAANSRAVGTGAFKFGTWNHGSGLTLVANKAYWGQNEPHVEQAKLIPITDTSTAFTALESNAVDLTFRITALQRRQLLNDSRFKLYTHPSWVEIHIIFRTDQAPVNDVRVRQAIAYGIDREALVRTVLLGQGVVATSPLPIGCYGHATPSTTYTYDPQKSKSLLKAAGMSGGVTLNLLTTPSTEFSLLGQAIASQLATAGITVKHDQLEAGVFVQDLLADKPKHNAFVATYGWINGGPWHWDAGDALTHPRYKGAKLTNLVMQTTQTADGPARLRLLADAQEMWMQELPHFPLYYATFTDASVSKLNGYVYPVDGYQPVLGPTYFSK